MRSHLADYFQRIRQDQGLGLAQLARLIGYKNVTKGCNKIQRFEQRGDIHGALLRKLADALGIHDDTIESLLERDRREFLALWNEWVDQPIEPHLVIRLVAAFYKTERLPEKVETLDAAEVIAAERARHWSKLVCLVWTRRLSVWFNKRGEVTCRTEATPGQPNTPYMRLKGRTRSFLLSDPETGGNILRLIDWPTSPAFQPKATSAE